MPKIRGLSVGFKGFDSPYKGENSRGTLGKEDLYSRSSLAPNWRLFPVLGVPEISIELILLDWCLQ